MSKIKKILIIIGVIILVLIVVQVINAAKYKMMLNVKAEEGILGVSPLAESLDFGDLSRNSSAIRYVTLKSGGNTPAYIMVWKFGEISDLVKVSKNNFVLKPGEEVRLEFQIFVPPSAQVKKYTGNVWIFRLPKIF